MNQQTDAVTIDNTLHLIDQLEGMGSLSPAEKSRVVLDIYKARLTAEAINKLADNLSQFTYAVSRDAARSN